MMTIWKAVLEPTDTQEIDVPSGAEFLCASEQNNQICVWFKCDPERWKMSRTIFVVGTGHRIPDANCRYIGTASLHGGALVFHVFEQALY